MLFVFKNIFEFNSIPRLFFCFYFKGISKKRCPARTVLHWYCRIPESTLLRQEHSLYARNETLINDKRVSHSSCHLYEGIDTDSLFLLIREKTSLFGICCSSSAWAKRCSYTSFRKVIGKNSCQAYIIIDLFLLLF